MPERIASAFDHGDRAHLRSVWRIARLLTHVTAGVVLAVRVLLRKPASSVVGRLAQRWHRQLLRLLGMRLTVIGSPCMGPHLTVANHISWLDISVIYACEPLRFVSKSEVGRWPVAGWMADAAGTFYIERGRGGSAELATRLTAALRASQTLALFPEGTTSDGGGVLKFHARLFAAAIDSGAPVQPVLLRYGPDDTSRRLAPFVGNDDLISHLLRLLRAPRLQVEAFYLEPIDPAGHSRDSLAEAARRAIVERQHSLGMPVQPPAPQAAHGATDALDLSPAGYEHP